uniref:Response regulatory domain-containing protein n=1 Tax=Entomoneis paludosa TaxID=265537 RepID=A0A7S2Y7S2_9STRA|mmetsp:Transcript_21501/g.44845  ORF Transcript_21501/g.44845 Transcript_21501/m.44845 type:complete len:1103 (+) Transcript_21501:31-3339(+)
MSDRPNRSVVDYDSEDALRKALMAVKLPDDSPADMQTDDALSAKPSSGNVSEIGGAATMESEHMDWVLPSFDPETTEVQSMKEELHRLQVLKSYLILDADREDAFERLTGLAARFFHVPIALVSLVDLGRQWFMSNRGLGDVRETPRKHAFCAHAILNKHNILIVPDASKDFRFRDNPLVTGPPNIRFYAGAPLISPEGYKLGTFCIIDDKTRMAGLSQDDQASLRDLADMAVKEMVERRTSLKRHQNPAQLIAYTAHDLMTPLTGVQLSLSLLKEDEEMKEKLGGHQQELLSTAANCSDLMIRICQTAIDTLREESAAVPDVPAPIAAKGSVPATKMSELINSLTMIMEPIPKKVPLAISLDSRVPSTIMSDDLKLFRSTLNLISNAIGRTELGVVHLTINIRSSEDKPTIVFECMDTGPDVEVEEYQYLFHPSRTSEGDFRLGLSSVATLINSLDGEYGFRPLGVAEDGTPLPTKQQGSLFWFSVPLYTPESFGVTSDQELPLSVIRKIASNNSVRREEFKQPIIPSIKRTGSRSSMTAKTDSSTQPAFGLTKPFGSSNALGVGNSSSNSLRSVGNRRVRVEVENSFQASAMQNSCFSGVLDPVTQESNQPCVPKNVAMPKPSTLPASSPANQKRKRRALIIEDTLIVRKTLVRALERMGMSVTQAVNGSEGLDRMKAKLFDFVLCDFLMPVMDGIDCVRQYRDWEMKNRPDIKLYIVGISAHADANDGNKGISAGMNEFRPKPVTIPNLKEIQKTKEVSDISKQLDEIEAIEGGLESGGSSASLSVMEQGSQGYSSQINLNVSRGGSGQSLNRLGSGRSPLRGGPSFGLTPSSSALNLTRTAGLNLSRNPSGLNLSRNPSGLNLSRSGSGLNLSGTNSALNLSKNASGMNLGRVASSLGLGTVGSGLNLGRSGSGSGLNLGRSGSSSHFGKRPVPTSLSGQQNHVFNLGSQTKRQKIELPGLDNNGSVSLIATESAALRFSAVQTLEQQSWKVHVVQDGREALKFLKMRNWNAVLIDDNLPVLSGAACVDEFRAWEQQNRVNRQRNLFMVCSSPIPSVLDKSSVVQPPTGFDGVLGRPVVWNELNHMLGMKKYRSMEII